MYAAKNLGMSNVWANELDLNCCGTLEKNFPETEISNKSISDLDFGDLASLPSNIDLLTAGFPCQSFSQAGGEFKAFDDPRGKLFFDIPRVIKLMPSPPKVVLLENVPNIKIFDKGSLLRTVLTEMKFSGYWVQERHAQILSSAEYGGTPQNRERLFIVCVHKKFMKSNPFNFENIKKTAKPNLFEFLDRGMAVQDEYYLPPDSKYHKLISSLAAKHGRERLFQIRRVEARACPENTCPTLTANMGDGGHNVPFLFDKKGLRRLTEDECLSLQGFSPAEVAVPDGLHKKALLKMAGNAVSVGTVQSIMGSIQSQLFSVKEYEQSDFMEVSA